MQTSSRPYYRDQPIRQRGHVPQISISDDNHHVTEAIGDMYGENDYNRRESRPLSFVSSQPAPANTSPLSPSRSSANSNGIPPRVLSQRKVFARTNSGEKIHPGITGQNVNMNGRTGPADGDGTRAQLSPQNSLKRHPSSTSETANAHFPLNNIDYESNPNAIVQELNNLSALRRMSMDVNASGDPDLPTFNGNFGLPTSPPTNDDPDDAARLYWVPASVHPELAPMEFKTFLDKKVGSLKRRSEENQTGLGSDALDRDASLRRRKSMLSKQIDNTDGRGAEGYQDGAERLEKRRSQDSGQLLGPGITNLQELEKLVSEPDKMMERLSMESLGEGGSADGLAGDDIPILPQIPSSNNSLKRSTRTTYRRGGSLRKGERTPFSKRAAQLAGGSPDEKSDERSRDHNKSVPSSPNMGSEEGFSKLSRVQTEPATAPASSTENFSRPNRMNRRAGIHERVPQGISQEEPLPRRSADDRDRDQPPPRSIPQPKHFVSQIASNGRIGVPLGKQSSVPSIVESPPSEENKLLPPQRTSSHAPPPSLTPQKPPPGPPPGHRPHERVAQSRTNQTVKPGQTISDMTSHPSPLPGNNTRTDSLSFIPTLTEDKRVEGKKGKDKKDSEGPRKSSWSWGSLLGSEEKEKEKERKREEESKKAKNRLGRLSDRSHDNTRLDLLQTTMDNNKGRESLVLDRNDVRLEEERKKDNTNRKSSGEPKKEKDSGFFSNLLGGAKKKGDRDSANKKYARNLSPDPPMRILQPDIDYNWTRFSILEERAIYRMAHIKLANPRRALHSQVLLSNFMYSYLAKVQQMHPQANLPQSVAQRQQASQQKKDQPEEYLQYQKYQEQQQRQQDQEEQQASGKHQQQQSHQQQQQDNFMDVDYDSYSDQDHDQDTGHRPQSRASQHPGRPVENGYNNNSNNSNYQGQNRRQARPQEQQQMSPYAYQQGQFDEPDRDDDDDMWQ